MTNETIAVPVVIGFDQGKIVGELTINRSALPSSPDFVFALGFRLGYSDDPWELICVSIVPDSNYAEYVKQNGD